MTRESVSAGHIGMRDSRDLAHSTKPCNLVEAFVTSKTMHESRHCRVTKHLEKMAVFDV